MLWNEIAHAQKPYFVLMRLKWGGTCAETRFRLTEFEMWWHMRRNQISSYWVWNVMTHAHKHDFFFRRKGRVGLNRQGPSVQSTTGCRGVRISGSNVGYNMFRGSVKGTGYPLHSPVSPSFPILCVTVYYHISTRLYIISVRVPSSKIMSRTCFVRVKHEGHLRVDCPLYLQSLPADHWNSEVILLAGEGRLNIIPAVKTVFFYRNTHLIYNAHPKLFRHSFYVYITRMTLTSGRVRKYRPLLTDDTGVFHKNVPG
jgi:hypothetical protein